MEKGPELERRWRKEIKRFETSPENTKENFEENT